MSFIVILNKILLFITLWKTVTASQLAKIASDKKWGLKSWIALDFKKWGLEPRSLIEIYAYDFTYHRSVIRNLSALTFYQFRTVTTIISKIISATLNMFWKIFMSCNNASEIILK